MRKVLAFYGDAVGINTLQILRQGLTARFAGCEITFHIEPNNGVFELAAMTPSLVDEAVADALFSAAGMYCAAFNDMVIG